MGDQSRNHSKTNTVLLIFLSAGLSAIGWGAKEIYSELRSTHDAVLTMRSETTLQITDLRARVAAVEVEIQKLKERK